MFVVNVYKKNKNLKNKNKKAGANGGYFNKLSIPPYSKNHRGLCIPY
jgi:hypothetical protein